MPHRQLREHLGGHRFEARHEVSTTLGDTPEQSFTDDYLLVCTAEGDCQGRLHNSLEHGVELIRKGEETYFRHRYQEYLRFIEEEEESERRVEQLWSVGSAVLDLLGPGVRLEPAGEIDVEGQKAVRYRLKRRDQARPPRSGGDVSGWRALMTVDSVEGEVALDLATGAPRRFSVRYRVSAPKGERRFSLSGSLEAKVTSLGSKPTIAAPESFSEAPSRDREVLEVRALLGNHRLNPGWFRGGGPHAARERPHAAMERPHAAMETPRAAMERPRSAAPSGAKPSPPPSAPSRPMVSPPRPAP